MSRQWLQDQFTSVYTWMPRSQISEQVPRTTAEKYAYRPLSGRQIRLLQVLPGSGQEALVARLDCVDFGSETPQYEALSYCWGDPVFNARIYLSNAEMHESAKKLDITQDLADALRCLRYPNRCRTLWIDQVCINQKDNAEKSAQVNDLMADIYRRTSALVVWIGAADEEAVLATNTIAHIFRTLPRGPETTYSQRMTLRRDHMVDSQGNFKARQWRAVFNLLCRPWFERTWIVQEAYLAELGGSRITVLCGSHVLDWEALNLVHAGFKVYPLFDATLGAQAIHLAMDRYNKLIDPVNLYLQSKRSGNAMFNVDHIYHFRIRKCTNAADRVNATRELWLPEERAGYAVNYSASTTETYMRLVRDYIARYKDLRPLGFCLVDKNFAMPSWTPDWSITSSQWPLRMLTTVYPDHAVSEVYDAMPNTTAIVDPPAPDAERILTISGYAMHTITMVGNDRSKVDFSVLDFEGAVTMQSEVMQDVYGLANAPPPSNDGQEVAVPASIWRALIADRNALGQRRIADPVAADFAAEGDLRNVFLTTISGRKLFVTREGDVGVGPYSVLAGDLVCLFPGAQVPFMLRQKLDVYPEKFELVGECYCHGLMRDARPEERYELRKFHLV